MKNTRLVRQCYGCLRPPLPWSMAPRQSTPDRSGPAWILCLVDIYWGHPGVHLCLYLAELWFHGGDCCFNRVLYGGFGVALDSEEIRKRLSDILIAGLVLPHPKRDLDQTRAKRRACRNRAICATPQNCPACRLACDPNRRRAVAGTTREGLSGTVEPKNALLTSRIYRDLHPSAAHRPASAYRPCWMQ